MNAGLSTQNAPHSSVVVPHYAFGAIAFLVASVLLYFASDQVVFSFVGPHALGIVHILVLGWISMIIFGALYQLIPVVMEVKLYSERLAYTSFALLATGTVLLSFTFWQNYIGHNPLVDAGGTFVLVSVILFVINALKSAAKTQQKTIENRFIINSVVWLALTVFLGIFIIINAKVGIISHTNIDLLKIHALWGIMGWFVFLVIGVASKLLPMFFIAHNLKIKYLHWSYYLGNTGLVLLSVSFYFNWSNWVNVTLALPIMLGLFFFARYNYDAYKARLRRKLDVGMKLSVMAFVFLALTLFSGILSLLNLEVFNSFHAQIISIYGTSLVLGFFTSLILGQMYKTLPFIVWLQKYQSKVGKFKTPMPADMYSDKVANAHFYSYIVAILFLFAGFLTQMPMLIKFSSIAFTITALLHSYNTFVIIFHKQKLEEIVRKKKTV